MTMTTTAPLTRRQAREIERLTGTRPVASAEQDGGQGTHAAIVAAPEAPAAPSGFPEEQTTAITVAGQEERDEPAQVPAAFTRSVSVRAQRPAALVRARRRKAGGFAAVAGAAALATAATVTPLLGQADAGSNPAAADLGAGANPGANSADRVAAGPAVQIQTSGASNAELAAAPETISGYQVTSFSSDQVAAATSAPAAAGEAGSDAQPAAGTGMGVTESRYVSPFPGGTYSEGYGTRGGAHNGIDVVSAGGGTCGAELVAVTSGTVTFAGYQGGYGNHVEMRLDDGTTISYSHLQDGGINVAVGQQLAPGDLIGLAGTTGNSTGCHLHFEVKQNGDFVNPTTWLAQYGLGF